MDPPFNGKIAVSVKDAAPSWPAPTSAPSAAPNIVVILLDDIGFADTSTFGGLAQTPELDRLAAGGLRYNNFHVTAMCSPTRAALLTGRNHHRVGFGTAEMSGGFPGYNFNWKKSTVSVAEVLRRTGYSTAVFGKWHNTPYLEISPVGPFDRWPTNLGFEQFYGFIGGRDSQWEPSILYRNTTPVEPPTTPQHGYHFTTDITNEAINWLQVRRSLTQEKPYFLYFAPGAVHSPHHAPREWIEKYRGHFDAGWDALRAQVFQRQKTLGVVPTNAELTPRPQGVPSWDSLSEDQKRLYARKMEIYAGFIAHTDHEVGRLIEAIRSAPNGDNTLIFYVVGDNGATGEEGPNGTMNGLTSFPPQMKHLDELGGSEIAHLGYPSGWAWLGNTPFQHWKGTAHFGGTRDPLVVSWPKGISNPGGVRSQFTHVVDVAATIYEITGVHFPSVVDGVKQQSLDGVSFSRTFGHANEPSHHRTQYFEMLGNRAIYNDGWVAVTYHWAGWQRGMPIPLDFTKDRWELYHVNDDFSQARDLSAQYVARLQNLQTLFDVEARKNDVYPLGGALAGGTPPSLTDKKREFVYHAGMPRLQKWASPPLAGQSYSITARAMIPAPSTNGVIVSYGGRQSGFVLYLKDDRLIYENRLLDGSCEAIASRTPIHQGEVTLGFSFTREAMSEGVGFLKQATSGTGRLFINDEVVGEANVAPTLGTGYSESLGIGQAFGSPVSCTIQLPSRFTGTLREVKIALN